MIETNLVILILGALLGCLGAGFGVKWIGLQANTPERAKQTVERMKEDIDGLKKEINYWRGKVSKNRQSLQTEDQYDLSNDSDIVSLAKSVLPGILDFLPKDVQKGAKKLLENPDLIELLNDIYKKHPKEIQSLMGGFLKKDSRSTFSDTSESQTRQLFQDQGA